MYALRSLLSVKYLVMPNWEVPNFEQESNLYGFELLSHSYPYNIYENTNFIPMGFVYDNYVSYEGLDSINAAHRSHILLRAIGIDESLIDKYDLPLTELAINSMSDYTYSTYLLDVAQRKSMASYYFNQTDDGFECKIQLDKCNLVFFSVPYDEGFTAYVNGEKAEVEKVSYGMCAVYAPAGDNEIVFTYRTPQLNTAIVLTAAGWVVYAGYMFMVFRKKNNKL